MCWRFVSRNASRIPDWFVKFVDSRDCRHVQRIEDKIEMMQKLSSKITKTKPNPAVVNQNTVCHEWQNVI